MAVEPLEARRLLAITSAVVGGTLTVSSDAADAIAITCGGGDVKINADDPDTGPASCASLTSIAVTGGPGANAIDSSGVLAASFPSLTAVRLDGGAGDDTITGGGLPDSLIGGPGNDVLNGSATDAQIVGGAGLDQRNISGGSGENLDIAGAVSSSTVTLDATEVADLLTRAAAATPSDTAIIAVVDRQGHILGVRTEAGVAVSDLVFAIDGAVAKARTAAFFANNQAPLTSRTIRFISQTTITQREVDSNPNSADPFLRGPGFVAPIGIAGQFPPGVSFTPQVDLFAIEHTNRDSIVHSGSDHVRGTGDDIVLPSRFNVDSSFIPLGQEIDAPESYGLVSGLDPDAQSRGIATLPGGIPIYKDSDGDGVADQLVGGIGVFFPGPDGFASFEQAFGVSKKGINAPLVLEAEYTAFAAVGGVANTLGSIAPLPGISPLPDVPGRLRLDLVGITLEVFGPNPRGLKKLLRFGRRLGAGADNGVNPPISVGGVTLASGEIVPEGYLVTPHGGGGLTAADVTSIVSSSVVEADRVRAAIRLPLSSTTRMIMSVTDTDGDLLGLFRMPDATFFSIDVATAKARNTAYYADAGALQPADRVDDDGDGVADLPLGVAFTNRTFRYLALPRFPEGIDGKPPGAFSILTDGGVDLHSGAAVGPPLAAAAFTSVVGFDAFNPGTNFRDPDNIANQNGIVFFPGSAPIYKSGVLVGGFGVSGDGVDQDDVVTAFGAQGFLPPAGVLRADQVKVRGVRLPFIKFLRNPEGLS